MDESTIELYDKAQTDALLDEKADADNVYTKAEMDTALGSKADAADVYTKGEMDTALGSKADAADVYTKTEADALLSAKADATDVYTKTEADALLSAKADAADVYTKTEADALLNAKEDALPSMSGNAGKVLAVNSNATGKVWVNKGRSVTTTTDISNLISFMNSASIGDQIILAIDTDSYGSYTKTPYNWVGSSRPISSGQRRNYCYAYVSGSTIHFVAVRPNTADGILETSINSILNTAYKITYA